jgi:hypothetical protein
MRVGVVSLLLPVSLCALVAWLVSACPEPDVVIVSGEVFFDGSFLGPCTGDASKVISASACPGACLGTSATAYCTGTNYDECVCASPVAPKCDSGCCIDKMTGYIPQACTGKVVTPDPSEGLCEAGAGYLKCNDLCYASFVCEIPDGYTVVAPDGAPVDGGRDATKDGAKDAPVDAVSEGAIDAPSDVILDAPADARDGE